MHIWVLLVVIGAMCAQKIHSAAVLNFFTALWADSPVEQNMEAIDDPTNFTQQRSSVEAVSPLFSLSSVDRLSLGLFSERVKKFIEQEKTEIEKTACVISTRKEPWGKKSLRENVLVPKQERLSEFEQLLEATDINKLPNFSSQQLVNIGWRLIEVYQHILQFPLMQKPTKRGAYNSLGVASEGGLIVARVLFSVLTDKKRDTASNQDGIVAVINALDELIKNPNLPAYAGE